VILEPPRVEQSAGPARFGVLKWVGAFLLSAVILAGVIGHYAETRKMPAMPAAQPTPTAEPTPTVQPTPTPALGWHGDIGYGRAGVIDQPKPAPKAELVKLPPLVKRAELVSLPVWDIGETHPITMPYNEVVNATYIGWLGQESQLPRQGNLGDMYVVGRTPWVWTPPPGGVLQWVDP
jgi:hypothetical protein